MLNTPTQYMHIQLQGNVPIIAGTTMKVVELVTSHLTYGWSPEELHFQYPHIALSKIYSALAYYWDHKQEIDTDIQRRLDYAEQMRLNAPISPLQANSKQETNQQQSDFTNLLHKLEKASPTEIEIALSERETVQSEEELTPEIIAQFQQRLQSKEKVKR